MAGRRALTSDGGEHLLASKLQVLSGTGSRRPGVALRILTGGLDPEALLTPPPAPLESKVQQLGRVAAGRRQYAARTVYLGASHLHDIELIMRAWQQVESRRLTRSAVLRRAVEHLRVAVEADSAKSLLEHR